MGTPFIEKHANGWYRIGLTNLAVASITWHLGIYIVRKTATGDGDSFTGDGQVGFSCWGVQYENGTFPTSYIHNEGGSSLTRSADIASISGDNFGTYRTNLCAKSTPKELISNNTPNGWSTTPTITEPLLEPYAALAPDGTFSATKVTIKHNPNTNEHQLAYRLTSELASNAPVTFSFYARTDIGTVNTKIKMGRTSTVSSSQTYTITNEWQRFEIVDTGTNIGQTKRFFGLSPLGSQLDKSFYIWGVQVEENGTGATNFIPSTDTFTSRLGNATYVDSNGLIKTSAMNYITYSEDISQWTIKQFGRLITVTNTTHINPTGVAESYKCNITGSSGQAWIQSPPTTGGGYKTASVYLKAETPSDVGKEITCWSFSEAVRNITSITLTADWQRVIFNNTDAHASNITEPMNIGVYSSSNTNSSIGFYLWGAQFEDGLTATDYVKTTGIASGAPRYSHDPETLVPTGLYLEPAATNYWRSSNLNSSHTDTYTNNIPGGYTYNLRITPNATTAPDGTETAALVVPREDVGSGQTHWFQRNHGQTLSTFSVFLKYNGWRYVSLRNGHSGNGTLLVDLLNGTIVGTQSTTVVGDYKIEAYPNGWYRVSSTLAAANNGWSSIVFFEDETIGASTVPSHTSAPDGVSGIYVWGLQVEATRYASSVIITNGTTVTRPADTYTSTATTVLDRDGGNKEAVIGMGGVASAYNSHIAFSRGNEIMLALKFTNNSNGLYWFYGYDSRIIAQTQRDTTGYYGAHAATIGPNIITKTAFNVNETSINHSVNGGSLASSTYSSEPTTFDFTNGVQLFQNYTQNSNRFKGTVDRITLWNKVIPNQSLINITT